MDNGPILLVDAYNVFARAYCVVPLMSSHGHHLGGSVGFMKSLSMYIEKFKPSRVIVCWEGGGSARRRQILPEYKLNRKPIRLNRSDIYEDIPDTAENFNYQIALLTRLLQHIPVQQVYVDQCEADDIIGYICRYAFPNEEKLIVSMDQDLHQLLSEETKQYSPASKKIMGPNYVLERYGLSAENFITARCFIGDTSDGISGIKGCGFKSLVKHFPELKSSEFVSVEDILSLCAERNAVKSYAILRNILQQPDVPKRNWQLMYLDNSNLSAEHVKKLKFAVEDYSPSKNKFAFLKDIVKEGVDVPRGFDVDRLYLRINSCINIIKR
tara:strand:+ start:6537 stop:7514 length:978 start_codon:yes stop_codon:yes gene_type:complete